MKKLTFEQYACRILLTHLKRMAREMKGAYKAKNPEHVHQARVASRRLRNAFWVFEDMFSKRDLAIWKNSIKKMADDLSLARDLDTQIGFLGRFEARTKKTAYKQEIEKAIDVMRQNRRKAQPKVVRALKAIDRAGTVKKIEAAIKRLSKPGKKKTEICLEATFSKKVNKRLKKMLFYEEYVYCPNRVRKLHLMRIATKKLRYTLENFEPLYKKKIKGFIDSAHDVQDHLGRIHDLDVWILFFRDLAKKNKKDNELARSSDYFIKTCSKERAAAYKEFVKYWKTLKKNKTWKLLKKFTI